MLNRLLLPLVGLLIFLFGLHGLLLSTLGAETSGVVTAVAVKPQENASSVRDYTVAYRFSANGQSIAGQSTWSQVYNVSQLPAVGASIRIRYLTAVPQINSLARSARFSISHLVIMLLGTGLIYMGIKGRLRRAEAA